MTYLTGYQYLLKNLGVPNPSDRDTSGVSSIILLQQGGYDTHDNQTNSLPGLLKSLAYGIYGFLDEMINAGIQDSVTVLITTEFGRSNAANGAGTDHGYGFTALAIGGAINGGPGKTVYGQIPDTSALNQHYLPVTQDIRNVYFQIFQWMGIDPFSAITDPGFKRDTSLQLYA